MAITKASLIDLNGQELILDADADTSITADTDDRIDFKTGGTDRVHITSAGHLSTGATSITNGGGYNKVIQVSGSEGCFSAISSSGEGLFAQNGANTQVINRCNGYMEFRTNNTEYFRIAAGQIDVKSADLTMDDNRSLYIGDGNDLRIYHSGSHSYIKDQGTGNLHILTNHLSLHNAADDKIIFHANDDGYVIMPNQPAFSVQRNAAQSNIATGGVNVTWQTEIFDQNADFASDTFTAPVTGRYQFNIYLRLDQIDTAASFYQVLLITSNRSYAFDILDPSEFNADLVYWQTKGSVLADMDASDTAYVQVNQHGGTAQTDISYDGDSHWSGYLVA